METFRHQKSPSSERFLGRPFYSNHENVSSATAAGAAGNSAGEFDEGDMFLTSSAGDSSSSSPSSSSYYSLPYSISKPKPVISAVRLPSGSPQHMAEKNFGILAALPEDDWKTTIRNPSFLQRKASIPSSSSASTSPSSSAAARMIPAIPKPKWEYSFSMPVGKMMQQSAPVNVPVGQRRERKFGYDVPDDDDYGDEEEEMLPPHEIVARASAKESPMTTFSMLEGAGRTLKGRDLRRVRNAVWRQTGFLD